LDAPVDERAAMLSIFRSSPRQALSCPAYGGWLCSRENSLPLTFEGLLDFYQTQTSWIFDTMWYHANQYTGSAPAESVEIALGISHLRPGNHLDFGAGPGSSSLFFHELGWRVSLADVSTTFQNFAKWRLQKHGVPATFYDNSKEDFPAATFDLITAFDVMVHVPNIAGMRGCLSRPREHSSDPLTVAEVAERLRCSSRPSAAASTTAKFPL
jgi:SAM-dependent methyltransferase